ncbi:MAG: hypothetical protein Q4D79_09725 [Propionibacteriaceae bacterium]|nr:hypothetical protein [Propionibacteriaceae bacterium]
MSNEFEYDRSQTASSQKTMSDEAAPAAREIADLLETVATSQTERKWGVESGALDYKNRYERNLHTLRLEFLDLEKRIQDFVEALQASANALEANEQDAEAAQLALQQKLAEQERPQYPVPNTYGPDAPPSYDTTTPYDPVTTPVEPVK